MSKNLKHLLSERAKELPESEMAEIIKIAEEDRKVLSLGPGEPDFTAPKTVIEAAKKALDKGFTHYSAPGGRHELKDSIARKLEKENKIPIHNAHNNIFVGAGSTEAMLLSSICLIDAGQEVIVPNPSFLAYKPTVELMRGNALDLKLGHENGFQIEGEEVEKLVSRKTKAIIFCTPSNPTGTVLKKKHLEEIADIAVEHELMVLSDEAYEDLVYEDAKHVSIASLNGMFEYCLTFHTFSKSFAMPGFRTGYASGPKWLIEKMSKLAVYSSISANTVSQIAAKHAIEKVKKERNAMRNEYNKRRKFVLKRIKKINGLHIEVEPKGAFYVFPKIEVEKTSKELSHYLLEKAKVLTVTGTEFGTNGEGFLRLSYATALPKIEKAFDSMEKAMEKL